ncbi:hypothetical protein A6U98_32005 [Rhizobium sp. WYCCWR10014]|nr:hypothetical protein A6U98_32005 [Rhizobium sp. WYCCWR10014]
MRGPRETQSGRKPQIAIPGFLMSLCLPGSLVFTVRMAVNLDHPGRVILDGSFTTPMSPGADK